LRRAVSWLRLSGRDRIVINSTEDDAAAGAGRFYQRFGWEGLARKIEPRSQDPTPQTARRRKRPALNHLTSKRDLVIVEID